MVKLQVRLTFGQIYPPRMMLWVRMKIGETFGQVELWSDVPLRMMLWVRLTFGQTSGPVDLWSDVHPRYRHLVAKCDTSLGQFDI